MVTQWNRIMLDMDAEITIGDIVNTIQKVSGLTPKIVWDNSKPTTIPFRMVSTEKINNLGFKAKLFL